MNKWVEALWEDIVFRIWDHVVSEIIVRDPDFIVGNENLPYLQRWYVIPRNPFFNIYVHRFLADDDDSALHDHPWPSLSILLQGSYIEHTEKRKQPVIKEYFENNIKFRSPWYRHRIALKDNEPCLTLFITGPAIRNWGFWCDHGFVKWQDFVDARDSGKVGRGCE